MLLVSKEPLIRRWSGYVQLDAVSCFPALTFSRTHRDGLRKASIIYLRRTDLFIVPTYVTHVLSLKQLDFDLEIIYPFAFTCLYTIVLNGNSVDWTFRGVLVKIYLVNLWSAILYHFIFYFLLLVIMFCSLFLVRA